MTLEPSKKRKKEDTLKALRDTGWSLVTNTVGRILELDQGRKKGLGGEKERRLGLEGVFCPEDL